MSVTLFEIISAPKEVDEFHNNSDQTLNIDKCKNNIDLTKSNQVLDQALTISNTISKNKDKLSNILPSNFDFGWKRPRNKDELYAFQKTNPESRFSKKSSPYGVISKLAMNIGIGVVVALVLLLYSLLLCYVI